MIRKIDSRIMGKSRREWLKSWFHFSFAEYYNPRNVHYSVLRVLNDDLIEPGTGFDRHPHRDMEIITYVVNGELTHSDHMKNTKTLKRGQVQYMSAGTGILHSEHNFGSVPLRLLQIWILPDEAGYKPQYSDYAFPWEAREDRWLHLVSGEGGGAPVTIHQDANLFAALITKGRSLSWPAKRGRQVYLVQVEGEANVNGIGLNERDALEAADEALTIEAVTNAHVLLFDLPRDYRNESGEF